MAPHLVLSLQEKEQLFPTPHLSRIRLPHPDSNLADLAWVKSKALSYPSSFPLDSSNPGLPPHRVTSIYPSIHPVIHLLIALHYLSIYPSTCPAHTPSIHVLSYALKLQSLFSRLIMRPHLASVHHSHSTSQVIKRLQSRLCQIVSPRAYFFHSSHMCLLSTYFVPDTVLAAVDTMVKNVVPAYPRLVCC